jgi:hypothetical protein
MENDNTLEFKKKLIAMTPEKFKQRTNKVQWNLSIDQYVDDAWREFQVEHGKINKSQLLQWLLEQYMGCHKNNDNE